MSKFKNEDRLTLSREYYIADYAKSKFLVSDLSQTVYTYSLTTLKPIITFIPTNMQRSDMSNNLSNNFGYRVRTLSELIKYGNKILSNSNKYRKKIKSFRKENIYNLGKSVKAMSKFIDKIIQ